ncbi:hypothetical protein Cni_G25117 [Canna indica]|uniref:Uncharacterized protein n=1 Tax=Canna indica TaxID=4628 RepID=A0AAQ3KXA5_9LILI|nr:hypothetical protein Cni_G25117 [Canna indica]
MDFVKFGVSYALGNLAFMNSTGTLSSAVSCTLGNKGIFGLLVCLLPGFLGFPVFSVDFQLFKAIVRNPSSSVVLGFCGGS